MLVRIYLRRHDDDCGGGISPNISKRTWFAFVERVLCFGLKTATLLFNGFGKAAS